MYSYKIDTVSGNQVCHNNCVFDTVNNRVELATILTFGKYIDDEGTEYYLSSDYDEYEEVNYEN